MEWKGSHLVRLGPLQTYLHYAVSRHLSTRIRNYGEPERWGYGLLWWVWEEPLFVGGVQAGFMQGAYSAMGTGGQFITVLPARVSSWHIKWISTRSRRRRPSPSSYMAMLSMIANAYCGDRCGMDRR